MSRFCFCLCLMISLILMACSPSEGEQEQKDTSTSGGAVESVESVVASSVVDLEADSYEEDFGTTFDSSSGERENVARREGLGEYVDARNEFVKELRKSLTSN